MGAIRHLWLQWKMLRLPWRKKFFVGQDLQGNTFWEFRDPLNPLRLRRIVHKSPYVRSSASGSHYADIPITPQWHQWLRQTRLDAPTLAEQQQDVARQVLLKENARLADQRWESKARYIEKPKPKPVANQAEEGGKDGRTMLATDTRVAAGRTDVETRDTRRDAMEGVMSAVDNVVEIPEPGSEAKAKAKAQASSTADTETTTTTNETGDGPRRELERRSQPTTSTPTSTPTSTTTTTTTTKNPKSTPAAVGGQNFEPEAWSPGSVRRRS